MSIQLNRLSSDELKEMASVMSNAFINHENFVKVIKNPKRRKNAMYHLFLMMYKVINLHGYIFSVHSEKDICGYITFMDANDPYQLSVTRVFRTKGLGNFILFLLNLRFSSLKKLIQYNKVYNQYHLKELPSSIHLYSVGVKDEYKGKGIMSNAIRETFTYFKDLGFNHMILETSDQANLPLYQKLGFEIDEIIKLKYNQIYFYSKELD